MSLLKATKKPRITLKSLQEKVDSQAQQIRELEVALSNRNRQLLVSESSLNRLDKLYAVVKNDRRVIREDNKDLHNKISSALIPEQTFAAYLKRIFGV